MVGARGLDDIGKVDSKGRKGFVGGVTGVTLLPPNDPKIDTGTVTAS